MIKYLCFGEALAGERGAGDFERWLSFLLWSSLWLSLSDRALGDGLRDFLKGLRDFLKGLRLAFRGDGLLDFRAERDLDLLGDRERLMKRK